MKIIDLQKAIDNYENQTGSLPKYIEMSDKSHDELAEEFSKYYNRKDIVKIDKFNDIEIRTFPSVSKWCWFTDGSEFDQLEGKRISATDLLNTNNFGYQMTKVWLLTTGDGDFGNEWNLESIHSTEESAKRAEKEFEATRYNKDGSSYSHEAEIEEWEVE